MLMSLVLRKCSTNISANRQNLVSGQRAISPKQSPGLGVPTIFISSKSLKAWTSPWLTHSIKNASYAFIMSGVLKIRASSSTRKAHFKSFRFWQSFIRIDTSGDETGIEYFPKPSMIEPHSSISLAMRHIFVTAKDGTDKPCSRIVFICVNAASIILFFKKPLIIKQYPRKEILPCERILCIKSYTLSTSPVKAKAPRKMSLICSLS
mmetsp:Transcript_16691/g.26980  ORF Transcript_16691/g.26980 Transcript_16691/m.26980 type:complete len:207 (+) Transcript_16691:1494-2114(+)